MNAPSADARPKRSNDLATVSVEYIDCLTYLKTYYPGLLEIIPVELLGETVAEYNEMAAKLATELNYGDASNAGLALFPIAIWRLVYA